MELWAARAEIWARPVEAADLRLERRPEPWRGGEEVGWPWLGLLREVEGEGRAPGRREALEAKDIVCGFEGWVGGVGW